MFRHLSWLHAHASKLERRLRRQVLDRLRPPRWLPCWLHGLWLAAVARLRRVPVIVELAQDAAEPPPLRVRHRLDLVGCVAAEVPIAHLPALCSHGCVRRLWHDAPVYALGRPAGGGPVTGGDAAAARAAATQPDPARSALGLEALLAKGLTGAGVRIAIVDTGVYPHRDLAGRIAAFYDLVRGRRVPYDDNGHGTHVAGLAAGSGAASGGRYAGSAPGAEVVAVKALDRYGAGRTSTLIAAIQWVVREAPRLGVRVLNLSLGTQPAGGCEQDPLCRAVGAAWAAGLVVCCAAGNEGPGAGTVASPGISPHAITVGAMDDRRTPGREDDTLASFSSRGPTPDGLTKPDLLAPGVAVVSLRAPGSLLDKTQPRDRVGPDYLRLSGTSMATPLVAGVCACLLQRDPGATPDAIRAALRAAAQDWGLPPNDQGAGYLDCHRL